MSFNRRRAPSLTSDDATSSESYEDDGVSDYTETTDSSNGDFRRALEKRRRQRLQQEWDESMEQLQLIFVVVLMPWFGKFWGRKWAHALHTRYLRVGLGKPFFYL
ncbi:SubName: Full=Uncharacterized protein {ECO:0000313/EMBL:CCA68216.1} [Serendipita indica DSM 11827]|uniref:Uncharacterized protein n=1 Tax=Serendipita indica (strain DSM 11827) TaxID=1109443 RepID=G4TA78_SERID|nr:SubName: Full=Uncharacterized protein {ECO:0000313/EMBL:CCA68216.1} [Serendipita indica DSM 11827]CCA68216.1 hypothetical protein PIIN_02082 [Serendipita indica DSM 11827]